MSVFVDVPVHPVDLIILAIAVVVAALGSAEFVACQDHRCALRKEQCGQQVSLLTFPQADDRRVVGWTLGAAIPRPVVRTSVAVVFAVGLVVFVVVADEIV